MIPDSWLAEHGHLAERNKTRVPFGAAEEDTATFEPRILSPRKSVGIANAILERRQRKWGSALSMDASNPSTRNQNDQQTGD
jgi:hypothetical protein